MFFFSVISYGKKCYVTSIVSWGSTVFVYKYKIIPKWSKTYRTCRDSGQSVDSQWTVSGDICVLQRDRHRTGPLSAVGLQSSLIFVEVSGGFCFSEEWCHSGCNNPRSGLVFLAENDTWTLVLRLIPDLENQQEEKLKYLMEAVKINIPEKFI